MADEDPFDVFSDDEEDSAEENEATRIARSLMEQVNLKLQESLSEKPEKHVLESSAYETPSNVDDDIDLSHFEFLELPWPTPLYKGPVSLVRSSDFGGGRGYVASKRLQPGTLVLVETPMFEWPKDQLGEALGLVSIRRLLEHSDASQIIQDMEGMYV